MDYPPTYEERLGPVRRRIGRLLRSIRWTLKGLLGLRRTILVEIRWRLGDEIMALPIYGALQERYPNCAVAVWTNYPELFEGIPHVSSVNDEALVPDRYICLRSAPRDVPRIEHYAKLALVPAPAEGPELDIGDWRTPLVEELPEGETPLVLIAPGATWPTKRWSVSHWQALSAVLTEKNYRVAELGLAGEEAGISVSFAGRTTLREAAVLLERADVAVTNDSGLMHLALALGTPVVALFGPTEPSILVRDSPRFHPLTNGRECRGCWNISQAMTEPGVCPLDIEDCMDPVAVGDVLARIEALLDLNR